MCRTRLMYIAGQTAKLSRTSADEKRTQRIMKSTMDGLNSEQIEASGHIFCSTFGYEVLYNYLSRLFVSLMKFM